MSNAQKETKKWAQKHFIIIDLTISYNINRERNFRPYWGNKLKKHVNVCRGMNVCVLTIPYYLLLNVILYLLIGTKLS